MIDRRYYCVMKILKVKFSGMGGRFNDENNFIVNVLKKRYHVVISEDPEYLFYSVNSKDYLDYNCVRIFYTAENYVPDFNICDYAIGFHYIDFGDRYIRYPLYLVDGFTAYDSDNYAYDLRRAIQKHISAECTVAEKSQFCSFVVSNANAAPCRERVFQELSKYKKINSGGRYLNNIGEPIGDKLEFQSKHKFVLAFENTAAPGYTTEKIVHAFSANAVPIYWGDSVIDKVFNSDSFINCNLLGLKEDGDMSAVQKVIDRVREIDLDDDKYLSMLKTPAFIDSNHIEQQKEAFEGFLFNIFDQLPEEAYRRNRYLWGERYERKQKIGNKMYWMMRKAIPIRDAFRSIFK